MKEEVIAVLVIITGYLFILWSAYLAKRHKSENRSVIVLLIGAGLVSLVVGYYLDITVTRFVSVLIISGAMSIGILIRLFAGALFKVR